VKIVAVVVREMDFMRRNVRGEMAEVFGEAVLNEDKRHRTFGMAQVVDEAARHLPPNLNQALTAYAKGVNAFIDSLDEKTTPVEFRDTPGFVTLLEILNMYTGEGKVFLKIDIEGFEAEALQGLSQRVKALSFEFTTIQRAIALACIDRCVALGLIRFNAALGESQTFAHADWIDRVAIRRWLTELPHDANSGDIYAVA